jgi:prefoldin subunit 5
MNDAPTLEQVRFDLGKLQAQVAALEQAMSSLAHDMMTLDLQIMAMQQRIAALERAASNADASEETVPGAGLHGAD